MNITCPNHLVFIWIVRWNTVGSQCLLLKKDLFEKWREKRKRCSSCWVTLQAFTTASETKWKPGARNSTQISSVGARNPGTAHHPLLSSNSSRKLDQIHVARNQTGTSMRVTTTPLHSIVCVLLFLDSSFIKQNKGTEWSYLYLLNLIMFYLPTYLYEAH